MIPSSSHHELIGITQFSGKEFGNNWVRNIRSEPPPPAPAKTQHIWFSFRRKPCVAFCMPVPLAEKWEAGERRESFPSLKAGTTWTATAGSRELTERTDSPGIRLPQSDHCVFKQATWKPRHLWSGTTPTRLAREDVKLKEEQREEKHPKTLGKSIFITWHKNINKIICQSLSQETKMKHQEGKKAGGII